MRHIKRLGLSVVTGLATALCCASAAVATTPSPDTGYPKPPRDKAENIELTAVPTQLTFIDVDPPGSSQGDQLVATGNLLKSGDQAGQFDEVCTVTRPGSDGPNAFQCQVTLTLPDGQITLQGVFTVPGSETGAVAGPVADSDPAPGRITLAVTGGTGRYRTAQGYVDAANTNEPETELTVHLVH
ncbi:hypothetical protein ABZ532_25495 [Streptomyces sp. NPDC019396]|uniref:hypothetical protein n=1 Tax=Streptomyces sp. NPDC019396 TaxID=3154687 RepID=UPI0033DC6C9F